MTVQLYLVRHSKTVFNTLGRLQGWSDSPLTAEGRETAAQLGHALSGKVDFDAAFSSTSPRAVETARIILSAKGQENLPLNTIEELREYCFGGFEGEFARKVHETIAEQRGLPDVDTWLEQYRHGSYNMLAESVSELDPLGLAETEEAFIRRLKRGMEKILFHSHRNERVLMVSHGMAITALLKSINPTATLYQSVQNTTVLRLDFHNGKWHIISLNMHYS